MCGVKSNKHEWLEKGHFCKGRFQSQGYGSEESKQSDSKSLMMMKAQIARSLNWSSQRGVYSNRLLLLTAIDLKRLSKPPQKRNKSKNPSAVKECRVKPDLPFPLWSRKTTHSLEWHTPHRLTTTNRGADPGLKLIANNVWGWKSQRWFVPWSLMSELRVSYALHLYHLLHRYTLHSAEWSGCQV